MAADFIHRLDTDQGTLIFNFTRIYTTTGTIYFTSVMGKVTQHFFHMELRKGQWKIVKAPQPPEWVMIHEEKLGEAIEDAIKKVVSPNTYIVAGIRDISIIFISSIVLIPDCGSVFTIW
jgi:zona occludens toxin (predicted ATPase)